MTILTAVEKESGADHMFCPWQNIPNKVINKTSKPHQRIKYI